MINKVVEFGDKVEIIKKNQSDGNEVSYYSNIQEILSEDSILISTPMVNSRIVPLELNESYYLCIYTHRGLFRCDVTVVERIKDEKIHLIKLLITSKIQKFQRRQYYRLDCLLSFQYKDKDNESWKQGIILDISGGGIRFTSSGQQQLNSQIVCHVQLNIEDEEKHVYVSGEVIESNVIDNMTNTFENRVLFETPPSEVRELIIKFVFEEERKRRKREKGL